VCPKLSASTVMTDTPVPGQYSWICPECSRKVPNRIDTCRCGFVRDDGAMPAFGAIAADGAIRADPLAATAPLEPTAPGKLPWIVSGAATLIAAGALVALQIIPVKPQTAAVMADAARTASIAPNAPAAPNSPLAPFPPAAPIAPIAPVNVTSVTPNSLEDVVSRAIPAIVSIEAGQGRGSGFFAAPRTVITNRHVIEGSVSVTVRLSTGQALPGRVETSSTEFDLAVVRVDSAVPSQPALPLGTVNDVRPGQEVIAIGWR
jgi:hypothetical protein